MLIEHARNAVLLVVGSRGCGTAASILLGSVSQRLAHHAPRPLVIVPPVPPPQSPAVVGSAVDTVA